MNTSKAKAVVSGAVILAVATGLFVSPLISGAAENKDRKIVVYEEGVSVEDRDRVLDSARDRKVKSLKLADVVEITSSEEAKLRLDPRVKRIDDDVIVTIAQREEVRSTARRGGEEVTIQAQSLPWGIDRVDAELVWPTGNTANPIKVAVIDTGISSGHPDLKANIKGGINTINSRKSWNDDNGHGSHVAGTIAGINNTSGVVGVAHQADLYAVKVLSASGSGYLSDIIEGIEWSVNNGMRVINMSLGTTADVQSMHDAVIAAKNAGVVIVAAAGNNGGAVIYPAAYPEVIAVSATDSGNNLASFSSRGPEVDVSAPGVSVYSTYKGTGYATLSGTSMATPHVAGVAALVLNTPVGAYDSNNNGKWDPSEVQNKIQNRSVDLGVAGYDNNFGWGLVNALSAVQP